MVFKASAFKLLLSFVHISLAKSLLDRQDNDTAPSITLDKGTFVGTSEGDVSIFRGIPYAQPPVGNLRFRPPLLNEPYSGTTYNATSSGVACIQQVVNITDTSDLAPAAAAILNNPLSGPIVAMPDDEDCLTLDVYTPANTIEDSKLPVVFWVYGGGFQTGSTSANNGTALVATSLQQDQPLIYVSVNYRLSALGFPGGAEVREAGIGNLGLQDQRMGLRWVQKYISAFGGDPSKVTIWGESAGSTSVCMQMLAYNGNSEGLFRGAFMQSGGPMTRGLGTVEQGQGYFDKFAADAGCADFLGSIAVFECLRNVSVANIRSAIATSQNLWQYPGLSLAWQPWADGTFLTENAPQLVLDGFVADVPFVNGDDDDEGTIFGLVNSNITNEGELRQYLQEYYFPNADASTLDGVLAAYSDDPALGSPFDTGSNNTITPEFKRIAAIIGDYLFQGPRRLLLTKRAGSANAYSFLNKRGKQTPVLGTFHGADLTIYAPGDLMDALINFVNRLDPNGASLIEWPVYTADAPALLTLLDGNTTQSITNDTFRMDGIQTLLQATIAGTTVNSAPAHAAKRGGKARVEL
ncbi:unnamed protein product [Peniophora sp. CBMAI 1063]|nr:unnamed protein product [Peniophora sp. CBMAI 1063]